jgi:aspartyl-tRNA(Asn)/glutamyl-tRNA(Gln) amidotransferase subunit A
MSSLLADLPRLAPRPEQTIAGIGRLLRQGEVSCVDILNACLEQVDEWEPKIHAWVVLDREGAMAQARALDEELRSGQDRGPLHGIPIGVKDIIDVEGLPTACGAKRWADRIAGIDAYMVSPLRRAGVVIMGKTVTTPYAWIDPPPTRNPWNLDRTPGGSSSGSAAAVSCGMCYAAFGTQTGGSITRPASFCGVASMKPGKEIAGFHRLERVYPLAASLDHVGYLARAVDDLRLLFNGLRSYYNLNRRQGSWTADSRFDFPDWPDQAGRRGGPARLGRARGFFERRAEPTIRSTLDDAAAALASAGADVRDLEDPVDFDRILVDHRRVMAAEAALEHSDEFDAHPDDYPPRIRELLLEGRSVAAVDYIRAARSMNDAKMRVICRLLDREADALITPATVGTAPDASTTGDPAFNSPWSYTGLPTISFPIGRAADGLPVSVQLVGIDGGEDNLLDVAVWSETAIRPSRQ